LRLHGHGLRVRQLQGPLTVEGAAEANDVQLRRYRCVECEAVVMVGPRGLVSRRLYSAAAIGLALALWALLGESASAVRDRVSPWSSLGDSAVTGWAALRRWTRALRQKRLWPALLRGASMDGPFRQTAETAAVRLAALAGVQGPAWIAAFVGAAAKPARSLPTIADQCSEPARCAMTRA
jgi:hypothetical protein